MQLFVRKIKVFGIKITILLDKKWNSVFDMNFLLLWLFMTKLVLTNCMKKYILNVLNLQVWRNGTRDRFRFYWGQPMQVQVLSPAPNESNPNQSVRVVFLSVKSVYTLLNAKNKDLTSNN